MKAFFKQVLAVVVGMLIVSAFTSVMWFLMLLSFIAAGDTKPSLSDGTVLHLNLNGVIAERAAANPFAEFMGTDLTGTQGVEDILTAIRVAGENDKVSGIYVEGGLVSADIASLEEIRKALTDFKKTGKFVLAYGDNYTQGSYYVASVADTVLINPSGMLDWHGMASQTIFYKDLLEKVGVRMQVFRVGTYKSAVEPFMLTEMSEPNRAQVHSFISDIWTVVCKDVAAARKLTVDSLNAYADRYMALSDGADYVRTGLVDRLAYVDEVRASLRSLAGVEKLNMVTPAELALCADRQKAEDRVAVYYAYGNIVGAEEAGIMGGDAQIVGPQVVEDLDELMNDESVKAVVLRVNSGGGSAYASEQMWRAVQLLKKKKPVVVSMGGMAASGGYYMSCGADYIVAEPTTLTGSIGIFGIVPDATGLLTDKLGLHFDVVKTNEASDFGVMGRPFNAGESAAMQAYVERGYRLFLQRVAEGRRMKVADVDSIAQGRVWTGRQAMKLKLVDKLGTLDDAVAEAARRAGLKEYAVEAYPMPGDWLDELMNGVGGDYMEGRVRAMLGEYYEPLRFVGGLKGTDCLQARIPYVLKLT